MFKDREDAGKKLAVELEEYKDKDVLVLAIPRGGVEIGYHVAKDLSAELSVIITRKLPIPGNPEAGFGAIAEDGSTYFVNEDKINYSSDAVEKIKAEQKAEIKRRIKTFRNDESVKEIKDRLVILVDDGIATGSTMIASIKMCKNQRAKKIVVAVPVTGILTKNKIERLVDDIVILEMPRSFKAVAQVYENWHDVTDKEAVTILEKWEKGE